MFTLTSQYALRAMLQLAQAGSDERLTSQEIATRAEIPPKYLSVILGNLAHAGLLDSLRGAAGGYRLVRDPHDISLFSIVQRFEPRFGDSRRCPFGNRECGDGNPCPIHHEYKAVVNKEKEFLEARTLADTSAQMTGD